MSECFIKIEMDSTDLGDVKQQVYRIVRRFTENSNDLNTRRSTEEKAEIKCFQLYNFVNIKLNFIMKKINTRGIVDSI